MALAQLDALSGSPGAEEYLLAVRSAGGGGGSYEPEAAPFGGVRNIDTSFPNIIMGNGESAGSFVMTDGGRDALINNRLYNGGGRRGRRRAGRRIPGQ